MAITPLVLLGRIVTFDDDATVIENGALYIGADERIEAVKERGAAAPAGFDTAATVETGGTIYPGLIDLHNHIAYNTLSLWASPTRTEPWERRDQWPRDDDYKPSVSLPANALCKIAGEPVLKYVETKAVIGGTTAIQGSAKVPNYDGWLIRNVEHETFRTGDVSVRQSVRELGSDADFAKYRKAMEEDRDSFVYHLSEGSSPTLIEEFEALREHDCIHPRLIAIHCTALGEAQFEEWEQNCTALGEPQFETWDPEGTVVWSPFSNLWLYGTTTQVVEARDAGLRVCLGTDWSPSGSKNLLGELKVADVCNRRLFDGALTDEQLCRMATSNPADALAWDDRIGRLVAGLHADVLVTTRRDDDPYRNLITAVERDVLFVAINGFPFYGTVQLMRDARAEHAEPIRVGRERRSIVLVYPGFPDADMTWVEVKDELDSARGDPRRHEQERRGARPGGRQVRMVPDKPWDERVAREVDEPTLDDVALPELDPLTHDKAFFRNVERLGFHRGLLDELRDYYA